MKIYAVYVVTKGIETTCTLTKCENSYFYSFFLFRTKYIVQAETAVSLSIHHVQHHTPGYKSALVPPDLEIGRASCRERVCMLV